MRCETWVSWSAVGVACLVLLCPSFGQGQVPGKVNYQGLLTDSNTSQPLVGEYEVIFKLYPTEVGGAELWSETDTVETDSNGVFSIVLGTKQPIPATLEGPAWLELAVAGEVLSPRREIVSVPFALRAARAENADSLGGIEASAFADSAHNHDGRYFTETELTGPGTINGPGNPVDWTKLKGVPAGFADGRDSTGGVGDGYSLDAMDGDPADALLIDDQGDVGIGLINPQARLDVEDSSSTNGTIAIRGVASSTGDGNGIAGVVGETRSSTDFNPGAGVAGFATSPTGRSSGVMGVASGDEGAGVYGMADHPSGETYGVYGGCSSPNGWAGYFQGARSYFSGKVGIGWAATAQPKLTVLENSSLLYAEAIRGEATSTTAHASRGVVGITSCTDTMQTGMGVMGIAMGSGSKSSGVLGIANGARGKAIEGIAEHTSGENIAIKGLTESSNGFGCYVEGPRNYFSGKIGIGTDTPRNRLHIHEFGASTTGALQMTNASTGVSLADGLKLELYSDGTGALANWENKDLIVGAGVRPQVTLHPDGKVSIGGQDTLGTVTVSASGPELVLNSTATTGANASIAFYGSGSERYSIGWHSANHALRIGGTNALFLTSDGSLGFDDPYPDNPLDVTSDGTPWGGVNGYTEVVGHFRNIAGGHTAISVDAEPDLDAILYFGRDGKAFWDLRCDSDDSSKLQVRYQGPAGHNWKLVTVDTLGHVGIGTTAPGGYKLYVGGTAYSTGGWSSSDARLKDNITPIDGALSKALALNGVSFEWRRDQFPDKGLPEGRHYGLIAQEVEKVLPEAVKTDGDGEKAVAYNEIIPVLVEALKAQDARIQSQDARIEALEHELQELHAASGGAR